MEQPRSIRSFVNPYIAFYRPNLHSYFICKWDQNILSWLPYTGNAETAAVLQRSTRHFGRLTHVEFNIRKGRQPHRIHATADGYYLVLANGSIVTILRAPLANFTPKYLKIRHTSIAPPELDTPTLLWYERDPAPAPPSVPAPAPTPPRLEPIPRRIAWLIAEDASKREETCAITFDTISPITCAVTTCFHTFDADSIQSWLLTNPTCPMCKRVCLATKAFEEGDPV